jgi:hypothetical protein
MLKGTMVTLEDFLRFVGAVERLAVGVFARSGVVAANDEVRAAIVLADQRVPDRFTRAAHAHGQRQQRKLLRSLRILRTQQLVATDAGVIVHVARLGHSDDWLDQKVGFDLLGRSEREFHVGAVHRIAGLEGNDTAPSETGKFGAQLGRSQAQRAEVVVRRDLQPFDAASDIHRIRLIHGVVGAGMSFAGAIEYGFGFGGAIGRPDLFNMQHSQHDAFTVAQGDLAGAGSQLLSEFFGHVERDRHWPENAIGQVHVLANTFVVGFGHEAGQRRETTVDQ